MIATAGSAARWSTRLCLTGLALGVAISVRAQPPPREPYTLGQGVRLGTTTVRLGGYIAIDAENPDNEPAALTFDDLSVFLFGEVGRRTRFFVEVEDSKFWRVSDGTSHVTHTLDLERLYLDYLHADGLKMRLGKFLTPVGSWNEIHPDPLTWTVSRPLASYAMFPTFVTGAEAFGTFGRDDYDVDYQVFVQATDCLDCTTGDRQTRRMLGGRVRWRWEAIEIGLPAVRYVDRATADIVTMSGADVLARRGRVELRGELTAGRVHRAADAGEASEYAWYLQGMVRATDRLFAVARAERALSRGGDHWKAWSAGALFRPKPAISLKLEFQQRRGYFPVEEGTAGRRVLASFGVLF